MNIVNRVELNALIEKYEFRYSLSDFNDTFYKITFFTKHQKVESVLIDKDEYKKVI